MLISPPGERGSGTFPPTLNLLAFALALVGNLLCFMSLLSLGVNVCCGVCSFLPPLNVGRFATRNLESASILEVGGKMARKAKVTERHRKVARALRRGVTDREALLEAGYSEATSRKGIIDVQKRVPALAQAINEEIAQQARELIAEQDHRLSNIELEQLVEAVLVRNSIDGERDRKGSSYAAKLIGSLNRVNIFEPEVSVNPLFMSVPPEWRDRYSLSDKQGAEIESPAPPALPPAPEPTGEPQQET